MIVVHHLNNSRSQRIVWLLEELGVIEDGGLVLAESGDRGVPARFASLVVERHGKVLDYLARMQARPAYRRAVEKGGAYAFVAESAAAAPFPLPR